MSSTDSIARRRFAQSNIQLYEETRLASWSEQDRKRLGQCYELIQLHLSARYRGDGRPFLEHLVRTASILLSSGESPVTVTAGLGHALYSHGDFCTGEKAGDAEKKMVRDILGGQVHELLDEYAVFAWNERSAAEFNREGCVNVPGRPALLEAILAIRIANEIEEAMDKALLYVGDHMRNGSLRLLKLSSEIAARLDKRALGELAQSVFDQYNGAQSDDLAGEKTLSYLLLPPSAIVQPGAGAPPLPLAPRQQLSEG